MKTMSGLLQLSSPCSKTHRPAMSAAKTLVHSTIEIPVNASAHPLVSAPLASKPGMIIQHVPAPALKSWLAFLLNTSISRLVHANAPRNGVPEDRTKTPTLVPAPAVDLVLKIDLSLTEIVLILMEQGQ